MKDLFSKAGIFLFLVVSSTNAYAQDNITNEGMTLWEIIRSGGWIMVFMGVLSIATVTLILKFSFTINESNYVPAEWTGRLTKIIERKDWERAITLCRENPSALSKIISKTFDIRKKGRIFIREIVEAEGQRQAASLWQEISYLSDIAVISPLVGLLGTVLGMIQAFNVIAFQVGSVKPILLAGGVSKAMVTTAAGLIIAIPAMAFYSYFKGRVQNIVAQMESVCAEFVDLIAPEK